MMSESMWKWLNDKEAISGIREDFESSYEVPMEREEGKRITEHAFVPYRDGG